VVNVVYRMCGEAELAEEAAQEAFLRAWQSLGRFNPTQSAIPGAAFRNWVYRIAMNLAVDMLRRERPTTSLVEPRGLAIGGRDSRGPGRAPAAGRASATGSAGPTGG
jgi:DNA-directed RNA polymerase specialized sigma24 family protein